MAAIRFQCDVCQHVIVVDASAGGSTIQCPQCRRTLTVPTWTQPLTAENTVGLPTVSQGLPALAPQAAADLPPIEGYAIVQKLGAGGMGAVYKARQISLNRFVALKVMSSVLSRDPEFIERFKREAATAAQFKHPNIVEVYTAGESNGTYYIAMDFVEGKTLREHIQNHGRLDPQEAIAITLHVAEGLKYAWNKSRMIHRDIKPDNIFLSQAGEVLVGDLGLAKTAGSGSTELTASGTMMGSPHYISPEQALAAKDIDFRADIYSLGCTLFHMLTGRTAYEGDSSMALMMKHVRDPVPDILEVLPECPRRLGLMVARMMAKNRDERPPSYEVLIAGLWEANESVKEGMEIGRSPVKQTVAPTAAGSIAATPTVAAAPRKQVLPGVIYGVVGVAAVLLLAGLFLWAPWKSSSPSLPVTNHQSPVTDPVPNSPLRTPHTAFPSAGILAPPETRVAALTANPKVGEVCTLNVGSNVTMELMAIPAGEFMLGSTKEEREWALAKGLPGQFGKIEGEAPRTAMIKQSFWMGRTEVTVGQWRQFVKEAGHVTDGEKKGESNAPTGSGRPWAPKKGVNWREPGFGFELRDDHPVSCTSWNDAVAFCRWLTERERKAGRLPQGHAVRLPTEAEWEYACRAGMQTKFWWGDLPEDGRGRLNWSARNDGYEFVVSVNSFGGQGRNRFGLADMLGNVWEWCLDEYDVKQAHEQLWLGNPNARVLRGGAFGTSPGHARCAGRRNAIPTRSDSDIGFRVAVGASR